MPPEPGQTGKVTVVGAQCGLVFDRNCRKLRDSPSLRPKLADLVPEAYDSALRLAAEETGKDESDFPQSCPYQIDQTLDEAFYPGGNLGSVNRQGDWRKQNYPMN